MSFSRKHEQPDKQDLVSKVSKWQNARRAATDQPQFADQWLLDLCTKLPDLTDRLLAWFIGAQIFDRGQGFHIEVRSDKWAQMIRQFFFAQSHGSAAAIEHALGKPFKLTYSASNLPKTKPWCVPWNGLNWNQAQQFYPEQLAKHLEALEDRRDVYINFLKSIPHGSEAGHTAA